MSSSTAGASGGPPTYEQVLAVVRSEIGKYVDEDFADDHQLHRELKILSDDLTAIALQLERRLKVKLPQSDYDLVLTAADLARAFHRKIAPRT